MATRTFHISDLSGEPDAENFTLGLDRTWYAVDLTPSEQDEVRELLDRYLEAGRKIGPTLESRRRVVPDTTVEEREEIRAWAKENDYKLAEYGRIPKKIFAAYKAAHPHAANRQQ